MHQYTTYTTLIPYSKSRNPKSEFIAIFNIYQSSKSLARRYRQIYLLLILTKMETFTKEYRSVLRRDLLLVSINTKETFMKEYRSVPKRDSRVKTPYMVYCRWEVFVNG